MVESWTEAVVVVEWQVRRKGAQGSTTPLGGLLGLARISRGRGEGWSRGWGWGYIGGRTRLRRPGCRSKACEGGHRAPGTSGSDAVVDDWSSRQSVRRLCRATQSLGVFIRNVELVILVRTRKTRTVYRLSFRSYRLSPT